MPVWHLLTLLYHLLSMGWTLHYIIMCRVKPDYCWVPTPSVSQLLSCFGTQSGLSSNIAQQNCYLYVLQQLSFIYSDLSPHLSGSSLLPVFFSTSQTSSLWLFFWGLTTKLGLFLLFWIAGVALIFPHKAPNQKCWLGSKAPEKQTANWPNKRISKKLSRLCEATIQVDATNNVCTSRRRINQDDAVCSNSTGVVFSHALK